jgi:hypothetical protein
VYNNGFNIKPQDAYIFKDYDVQEYGVDWIFMNAKRKELLKNFPQIYNYIGSYKAVINAINYFGYNDLAFNEYYRNVDENSKKYIHLQKQRFGDNFDIDITIDSAVFEKHIPPLAVQMLLENCFNHNIISKSKPLHIKVYTIENSLTVENNLQKKQNPGSTGQGLKNIEGRYRFTSGEAVKVESNENIFRVTIPLISKA